MIKDLFSLLGIGAGQTILITVLVVAICVIVILILRNVICWYWKINKMEPLAK